MIDDKRFNGIVNDIADVQFDIIAKLEVSEKKIDGSNMFIEFSGILTYLNRNY